MTKTPVLQRYLDECLREEAETLPDAVWVPLGPKATEGVRWLIAQGTLRTSMVLEGLPHPSGANAERIAYFLGRKSQESLSLKTNPHSLNGAREHLTRQVAALLSRAA